jgi:hypothetical protein
LRFTLTQKSPLFLQLTAPNAAKPKAKSAAFYKGQRKEKAIQEVTDAKRSK